MKKVIFGNNWQGVFNSNDLNSFDDIFDLSIGQVVNKNNKRSVEAFELIENGKKHDLFIKRFISPHFKDMYFAFKNHGLACSQGKLEWLNANHLIKNGINAYKPVACGQETILGFEKRSFVITEKLPGVCLTDFIKENWGTIDYAEKEKICRLIFDLIEKAKKLNISLRDLFVWHFFIEPETQNHPYKFYVIDLHRMKIKTNNARDFIRDRAALYFSMIDEYFDENLRAITVMGSAKKIDMKIFDKIKTRAEVLKQRRRKPVY